MSCPVCYSKDTEEVGTLGSTLHLRCEACGWSFTADEEHHDEHGDDGYDDSMDGDHASALASAGFGTDEDYGCYGDDSYEY